MEKTLRQLIADSGRELEHTVYRNCSPKTLDFKLVSSDLYNWEETGSPERQRLLYKNIAAAVDFPMLTGILPELNALDFRGRDGFLYFAAGLENVRSAIDEGRRLGIKGGPCIFSVHEVLSDVRLRDGSVHAFDYSTGKMYQRGTTLDVQTSLGGFVRLHAAEIEDITFRDQKRDVTPQEYANLLYAFQVSAAVHAALLVIPLPDLSYRKYLAAVLEPLDAPLRERVMRAVEPILYRVTDLFLEHIRRLGAEYPSVRYKVLHDRDRELCDFFYRQRAPYIERNRVLRALTAIPEKVEPIKDYISMQGLPYYLEGITDIIEVDSADEIDSYRKSKKAHKGAFHLSCILFPELLCADGSTTVYNAPPDKKGYGEYELVR